MDKFDCHIKGNQRNPSRRTFQNSLRIEMSLNLIFHYEKCRQVNLILPQYQYLDFYLNSMYLRFRFSIKILSNYLVSRLDILTTHLVSTIQYTYNLYSNQHFALYKENQNFNAFSYYCCIEFLLMPFKSNFGGAQKLASVNLQQTK